MAMAKTGYKDAKRGTTRVDVALNSDGNIATGTETAAGTKGISINAVNAENNLTQNTKVLGFFIDLVGGRQNSSSNRMTVSWEAAD